MERIGYELVDENDVVVAQFGGTFGMVAGIPNPLVLPNGDHVCGAVLGGTYEGYTLRSWDAERPVTIDTINAERDRRIHSGFLYNNVLFQSRLEDQKRIAGASTLALTAIVMGAQPGNLRWHGGEEDFAWIAVDNTLITMDAHQVIEFGKAAAEWESAHVFTARVLKDTDPLPNDYASDQYWPSNVIEITE